MKELPIVIINLFLIFSLYPRSNEYNVKSSVTVSKSNILIGEKITMTVKVNDLNNVKVYWEELKSSYDNIEIYSKLDYYKNKILQMDIVFTFFEADKYDDLFFSIPIRTEEGDMLYIETPKININVKSPLSKEELENIKNISDPSNIALKKEKSQAKMPFYFSFYIKVLLILLFVLLLALISYYFFYKYFIKGKFGANLGKLSAYENSL